MGNVRNGVSLAAVAAAVLDLDLEVDESGEILTSRVREGGETIRPANMYCVDGTTCVQSSEAAYFTSYLLDRNVEKLLRKEGEGVAAVFIGGRSSHASSLCARPALPVSALTTPAQCGRMHCCHFHGAYACSS